MYRKLLGGQRLPLKIETCSGVSSIATFRQEPSWYFSVESRRPACSQTREWCPLHKLGMLYTLCSYSETLVRLTNSYFQLSGLALSEGYPGVCLLAIGDFQQKCTDLASAGLDLRETSRHWLLWSLSTITCICSAIHSPKIHPFSSVRAALALALGRT